MSNLAYSVIYPQPRKLTLGLVLALSLFTLTVNAQNTVFRYNSSSGEEPTAQGTDIGAIQRATGAAEGDVIKVSDGAAFNTQVTNPVSGFTIESATGNVVNVPVQAGYNFTQTPTDPFNAAFRNVSFTGAENYNSSFWSGDLKQDNIIGITIDGKVSFSNFKNSVFAYTSKLYYPYKFTCTSGSSLTFSGNTANGYGAAIVQLSELNGNGSFMTFSGNTARSGGAIYQLSNLTGENNKLTFSKNTANGTDSTDGGGAIYRLGDLSGSGNTLEFSKNTAAKGGGAITIFSDLSGSYNTLEFSENTAVRNGGAIFRLYDFSGSGNTLTFTGNTAAGVYGGAIGDFGRFYGNNNTLEFTGNTAKSYGGAIALFRGIFGENNTLTFTGNTAGGNGGAICSNYSITFSGNNTLTFTGNKAGTKGNDIYLSSNLTFKGGAYSFDGGIWLAEYNGQTGRTTISNGAKVTIAGRDDDSVNEYEFRDVALTANLTATVDDIEYLHGNFSAGENGLMTIKKGSDTATIKSSTNYGVFDLLINKAENVETISISSGRIDIKGYIDATIELQNDAELQSVASFSPGNSAGRLETTGDFIATAGSLLIFEQEGDVYDQLIANNVTIDPETGIDLSLFTTFAPGAVYDIIIANGTLSVDQSWIDMIQSGLPEFVEASIYNGNTVRLKIDANAVPEPSTWALLILGAAGLAYMRKRSRQ